MTKHVQKDPYYAVIFTAKTSNITEGYEEMAASLQEIIKSQEGFISLESIKEGKEEITVSYWKSMKAIQEWSMNERHAAAKKGGKEVWYDNFTVRICEVVREYAFGK